MDKFIHRFCPMIQFMLSSLLLGCVSIVVAIRTFTGNCPNLIIAALMLSLVGIACSLCRLSYRELRQAWSENPADYEDFEDEE